MPVIPASTHVPFKLVSRFAVYAQSLSVVLTEEDAFAVLITVSLRVTLTLEMPSVAGAAAFFELVQ